MIGLSSILSRGLSVIRSGSEVDYNGFIKPRSFSIDERATLAEAARIAANWKIRNKLLATLTCGEASIYSESANGGLIEIEGVHRCERITCAYCEPRRIALQIKHAAESWPEELISVKVSTGSDAVVSGQIAYEQLKKSIRTKFKKKVAKRIISRLRCYRAPGRLYIVYKNTGDFEKIKSSVGYSVKVVSRNECLEDLKEFLYLRFRKIEDYIKSGNVQSLATDPWVGHVVSIRCGRKAHRGLPWLSKEKIREKAKQDAKRRRGDTAKRKFHIYDNSSGKKLKSSDEPFKSGEVTRIIERNNRPLQEQQWYIPQTPRPPN